MHPLTHPVKPQPRPAPVPIAVALPVYRERVRRGRGRPSTAQIRALLTEEPQSVRTLAARVGCSRDTAKQLLWTLRQQGAAVIVPQRRRRMVFYRKGV